MSTASSGLGISYRQLPEFSVSRAWRDGWKIFRETLTLFAASVLAANLLGLGADWIIRKIPISSSISIKTFLIAVVLFCLFFIFAIAQALISLTVFHRYNGQPGTLQADCQRVVSALCPCCSRCCA